MTNTMRWQQRFENFEKAYKRFAAAMDRDLDAMSELEKMGCVQAFEIVFELSWKTMKDFLEYQGVPLENKFPRTIIREAFASGLISDGQGWIDMLEDRNKLSHKYDEASFLIALKNLQDNHMDELNDLHNFLKKQLS